jgi:hypothetical protein
MCVIWNLLSVLDVIYYDTVIRDDGLQRLVRTVYDQRQSSEMLKLLQS